MNNSIETLSNEVCRIAIDTGKYLKEEQAKLSLEDIEFKGPRNYVTYIDKKPNANWWERWKICFPKPDS